MPRVRVGLALIAAATALVGDSSAAVAAQAQSPAHVGRPKPANDVPTNILPLPPAQLDNKLEIGGEDVKARKVDTRLQIDVRVNGSGPYRFVVDSGADTSVVGQRIARDLRLPLGTPAILNATTSRDEVDRVKVAELSVGSASFHDLELPALREADVGGDGLIGIDALVQQRLMLDFEKKTIKVEDARTPIKFSPDDIVIIARRSRGQLILTQVRAGGFSLDAVIDTGSEVTIGNSALRDKLIRRGRDRFWTVKATGVTGVTVDLQMANISELQLGPVTLRDVPIAFADVPPFALFGLADTPSLLLGTDLLETFRRVSLDFRARKVRFQLRRCETQGVIIATSPTNSFSHLSSTGASEICGR